MILVLARRIKLFQVNHDIELSKGQSFKTVGFEYSREARNQPDSGWQVPHGFEYTVGSPNQSPGANIRVFVNKEYPHEESRSINNLPRLAICCQGSDASESVLAGVSGCHSYHNQSGTNRRSRYRQKRSAGDRSEAGAF